MQMLRRNDLASVLQDASPEELISKVQAVAYQQPTSDNVYSIAEVAYISAKRVEQRAESAESNQEALSLYAAAAANAYLYLFDRTFDQTRNPYDPRFRRACDIYNNSLESALREFQKQGMLNPGATHAIETDEQMFDIEVASRGTWQEKHFSELKFVSDYKVEELRNVYRTFGLGVPLIAVYKPNVKTAADSFYPTGMSFPVTAFMRIVSSAFDSPDGTVRHRCVIELHDPLKATDVSVENRTVPLETDLTTPLAYSLDNPSFRKANVPLRGLRQTETSLAVSGLYMLGPYDPDKIPVVMIHGFWSSLITWMEMFNDLHGAQDIRDNFQFWFYLYPTGGVPLYNAGHLRQQLTASRYALDPTGQAKKLDHMVLVGHSMGGLLAKLQTIESENDFWQLMSSQPFQQLRASPEVTRAIQETVFFEPNPSVRRVVTIATPFRGSNFSNEATQWIGRKFITLPERLTESRRTLIRDNPSFFPESSLLHQTTSVPTLAANSPLLNVIESKSPPDWVRYHNIIGQIDETKVLKSLTHDSDGIVKVESARCPNADSEIIVPADHINVHRHPRAILEVHRILREHLESTRNQWEHQPVLNGSTQ